MNSIEKYRVKHTIELKNGFQCPKAKDLFNCTHLSIQSYPQFLTDKQIIQQINSEIINLPYLKSLSISVRQKGQNNKYLSYLLQNIKTIHHLEFTIEFKINFGDDGCSILSEQISQIPQLTSFSLSINNQNKITPLGFELLMDSLSNLTQLLELQIFVNDLTIKDGLFHLEKGLQRLTNLQIFSLAILSIKLGERGSQGIGKGLQQLKNLQTLKLEFLSDCQLGEKGCLHISNGIAHLINLKELSIYISSNKLGESGIIEIGNSLASLINLERLIICMHTAFQNDMPQGLGCSFSSLKSLKDLTLQLQGGQKTGVKGFKQLFNEVSKVELLEKFKFKIYWPSSEDGFKVGKYIGKSLKALQNLSSLSFVIQSQSKYYEKGFAFIADGLSFQNQLKHLDLVISEGNFTKIQEVSAFGSCFNSLFSLESLKLVICCNNYLRQDSMIEIGKGLSNLKNLKYFIIQINENGLGFEGMEGLKIAIENLTNLEQLQVSIGDENNIQAEGVKKLCKGIEQLVNLKKLYLDFSWFNYILKEGAQYISNTLSCLGNLKYLMLVIGDQNLIGKEGAISLSKGLSSLDKLQLLKLFITNNYIEAEGLKSIIYAVCQSRSLNQFYYCFNNEKGQHRLASQAKRKCQRLIKLQFVRIHS